MTGAAPGPSEPEPPGPEPERAPSGAAPGTPPRLDLGDPLVGTASEDRPESWGERGDTDEDRLSRYLAQRPPHHGQ